MLKNTAQQSAVNTAVNSANQQIGQKPAYKTVAQFSNENPAFTPSSLRNLIFKADERQSTNGLIAGNGLIECGAIIRLGRKILINEDRFFQWIEGHQVRGEN